MCPLIRRSLASRRLWKAQFYTKVAMLPMAPISLWAELKTRHSIKLNLMPTPFLRRFKKHQANGPLQCCQHTQRDIRTSQLFIRYHLYPYMNRGGELIKRRCEHTISIPHLSSQSEL